MSKLGVSLSRRRFLGAGLGAAGLALGSTFFTVRGAFAEELMLARTAAHDGRAVLPG